ncbi:hypothetical protein LIER_01754 [Lithospermum erythrorhizon]|uniref:Cupin type-1 domain-containing protein n=1 Tax=Lithospermum erythrorhizon TaxID=34254 RepID=A0AAV3NNB4_LITER
MAYSFYTFSLLLLVLFNGCFAQLETQQQDLWRGLQKQQQHRLRAKTDCSINRLTAQEPNQRFQYEAGETEYWDAENQEFQCAGVNVVRNVIQPRGLLLPHYNNAPQILYVIRGRGIQGTVFAGCAETYETEIQDSSREGDRQRFSDRHQKVRQFNQGDILALPAGVTLWFYNNGEEPLETIALLDTSNDANQLDQNYRNFFLAGNEQSGRYSRGRHQEMRERGQQQEQGNEHNIFRGFDEELLQEVFNVDRETARSLQGHEDGRGRIVRAENFQVLSPQYEDEEQEQWHHGGRRERGQEHGGRREREQEHGGRRERQQEHEGRSERGQEQDWPYGRRQQGHGGRREREQEQDWPYGRRQQEHGGRRERGQEQDWPYGRRQQEGEWPYGRSKRGGRGRANGLEETFCTMKLRENIEHPSRTDVYNPNGGRIATVNSQTLPILNHLRLSAEKGTLYRNAIVAPHWNINAHSIIYVIRGSARIQVVGEQGRAVLDEEVQQGQLVIVPQNFAVVKKAGEDGFEYIAFKTNDNAVTSPLAGRLSALRGMPVDVLVNAYQISREDAQTLKYNRQEVTLLSPTRASSRGRMSKAMDLAIKAIGSIM